jgi:hypothetical protein
MPGYTLATAPLATTAEQVFAARFWTCDFDNNMLGSLVTTGPNSLKFSGTFLTQNSFGAIIWTSTDTHSHPYLRHSPIASYAGMTLSFSYSQSTNMPPLNDPSNYNTITVTYNDGSIVYLRLWNFVVGSPATPCYAANIVIPFGTAHSGWGALIDLTPSTDWLPLNPVGIKQMALGAFPTGYNPASTAALAAKQQIEVDITNISCTGTMQVGTVTAPPPNGPISVALDYDDQYNITPERLVDTVVALGLGPDIVLYVGASHFYGISWDGTSVKIDPAIPINPGAAAWLTDLVTRLIAAGRTVTISQSFELFSLHLPANWDQQDWNSNPGITEYVPSTTLVRFTRTEVRTFMLSVAVAMLKLVKDPNELLDTTLVSGWADHSSGVMPMVAGGGPMGENAFVYTGTGSTAGFQSQQTNLTVVPGHTYRVSGYIDATACRGGNAGFAIYGLTLDPVYCFKEQYGVAGIVSVDWTCPDGVTSLLFLLLISYSTVANGQKLIFSRPSFYDLDAPPTYPALRFQIGEPWWWYNAATNAPCYFDNDTRVLYNAQSIYDNVVLADHPAFYYKLDEVSGTVAVDSSGNGVNGTYVGSGTSLGQPGLLTGDSGTSVLFNGSGSVSSSGVYNNPPAFSQECWFKRALWTSGLLMLSSFNDRGAQANGDNRLNYWVNSDQSVVLSTPTILTADPTHVVVTHSSTKIVIYINGNAAATLTGPPAYSAGNFSFALGAGYTGSLEKAAFYLSELSPIRVAAHYAAGITGDLYAPEIDNIYITPDAAQSAYLTWLQGQLGSFCDFLRDGVRAAIPGTKVGLLPYVPTILNASITALANWPVEHYKYPNYDFFQLEDYEWVTPAILADHSAIALPAAIGTGPTQLGYPLAEAEYMAGFVASQTVGGVITDLVEQWAPVTQVALEQLTAGWSKIYIWALIQMMRDGYVPPNTLLPPTFVSFPTPLQRGTQNWTQAQFSLTLPARDAPVTGVIL